MITREPERADAARRTRLASERTQLAWWRTSLTALAVAIGIGRVVPELGIDVDEGPYVVVGACFALYALLMFIHGVVRARAIDLALDQGSYATVPAWVSAALTLWVVFLCVATLALIVAA